MEENTNSFTDKFLALARQCKKETVLKGPSHLLNELKEKNNGLWSFPKEGYVALQNNGENHCERLKGKGEFHSCYKRLKNECEGLCMFEVDNSGDFKRALALLSEYENLTYKMFWRRLAREDFFS
ncbi:hypothetical protein LAU_0443 [Lausannevirus]|uniref:Uncharacterized protein n=2 Tax=Lausannevirus TaxID=999883 RepID=A0A0N9PI48_9VIRU|nr:hypothetical protein LAU_0443 [Lausannevirus]AEA07293.1 hypothetical protein LAU_0443 [Lausannevirus]ALH07101.1 hypothetical protein PMV_403 [Port-miou virus]